MEETAKKQPTPAFLEKLFDILEDNRSYSHLIAWQPDGNSFIIKKVNEFSEIVLPRYFKHSNIQSYIRQLNMYGFSKTRHDSNHHEFTHKLFQRGRRDLLPMIRRKTQQNSSKTATAGTPTAHSVTAAENNATNKSSFLALASQAQQAPSVQVHVSSEASQSTNGPEDENVDFESSTIIAMQSRILSLEDQVGRLSRICNDLLSQHNYLCEALHQCNTAPTSTKGAGGSGGGGGGSVGDGDGGGNVSGKGNTPACSESSKSSSTLSASASEGTTSASSPASGPTKRRLGENGADNDELKVDEEMIRRSPLKRMRSVDTASLIPIAQMTFRNGGGSRSSRSGDSSNNGSVRDSDDDEKRMTVFAVKSERGASISSNTDATTVSASSTSMSTASRAGSQGPLSTTNSNNSSSSAVAVDFLDFRVKKAQLPPFVSDVYKIAIVTHAGAATGGHQQPHRAQQHVYTHGDPDFALLMAKAGGNFDLGGLEAITNAATFLDHDEDTDGPHGGPLALSSCIDESTLRVKYPLFTASALAASNLCSSSQVSASAAVATANGGANEAKDAHRGDDAAASFARAGAPLTKAYSIG